MPLQDTTQEDDKIDTEDTMQSTSAVCCPHCGHAERVKVRNHFLVGRLGASMLSLVECTRCNTTYNGDTGKPAESSIAVYFAVTLIGVVIFAVLYGLAQNNETYAAGSLDDDPCAGTSVSELLSKGKAAQETWVEAVTVLQTGSSLLQDETQLAEYDVTREEVQRAIAAAELLKENSMQMVALVQTALKECHNMEWPTED